MNQTKTYVPAVMKKNIARFRKASLKLDGIIYSGEHEQDITEHIIQIVYKTAKEIAWDLCRYNSYA